MLPVKPFCAVPFIEAFSGGDSNFRNCCASVPEIKSESGENFATWWTSSKLENFRQELYTENWPRNCEQCKIQELDSGESFRTHVNKTLDQVDLTVKWPQRWHLKFGNICNLGCWICNENYSSVIENHKKRIGILSENFVDSNHTFSQLWPSLEKDILKSYDLHDIVNITIVGGEPLYNKNVLDFLSMLVNKGLSRKTRLEIHTNGTTVKHQIFSKENWNYLCIFVSVDAIGKKAEWLRYGSDWSTITQNIEFFKTVADYVEIHCVVSVLNIRDLPALNQYCTDYHLPLVTIPLSEPSYMSLSQCPIDKDILLKDCYQTQFDSYYNLMGLNADINAPVKLKQYIDRFNSIRKPLIDFDLELANILESYCTAR